MSGLGNVKKSLFLKKVLDVCNLIRYAVFMENVNTLFVVAVQSQQSSQQSSSQNWRDREGV
jgi:hypothetical protein